MPKRYRYALAATVAAAQLLSLAAVHAQSADAFVPVTDEILENPTPEDWLMWRRTANGWGYSPLDQITPENVGDLRMVWTRSLNDGSQTGTPLAYRGVMYMPNPNDVIQALDAATGDLIWEHRRKIPEDAKDYVGGFLSQNNRNIAIYANLIIDTSVDDHLFALDAETGKMVWRRWSSTTGSIPRFRAPARSSATARRSRAGAARRAPGPTPA